MLMSPSSTSSKSDRMRRVAIIGGGGHAREQLDLIAALNESQPSFEVIGLIVDPEYAKPGERVREVPVLGGMDWLARSVEDLDLVCAIGDPRQRLRIAGLARESGGRFCTLVHPSAQVTSTAELAEGVIVGAESVVSSEVILGSHVHVNIGCRISHDCQLDEFTSLAPSVTLAGHVRIGSGCSLGAGSVVSDRCSVGEWSITGAGAVVVDDLPANCTAVGVPARVIEHRDVGWQLLNA